MTEPKPALVHPTRWRLEGRNIVCFSTADWDTLLPTNKHQLMTRLARRNRVLFIETLGTRAPRLDSGTDLSRIARRVRRGFQGARKRAPGLWTISPIVRPAWETSASRAANRIAFRTQCGAALAEFPNPIVWIYSPYAIHLLDAMEPACVVYHLVDDLGAVPGAAAAALHAAEDQLLARADCVFCTERSLHDRAARIAPHARLMPNVADFRHFSQPTTHDSEALAKLRKMPHPLLLFSGNLAPHKVDLEVLAAIAQKRPDWRLALVGPRWEGADPPAALAQLERLPNVEFIGHVPYAELPACLHEADVLLLPYVKSRATRAVFPLKFFEYLATGKPVVSSPLPSLLPYAQAVRMATTPARWIRQIERALAAPELLAEQRQVLARRNTWAVRLRAMERDIRRVLDPSFEEESAP